MVRFNKFEDVLRGLKERGLSLEKSLPRDESPYPEKCPSQESSLSREESREGSIRPPTVKSGIFTASSSAWVKVKEFMTKKDGEFQDDEVPTAPINFPALSTFQQRKRSGTSAFTQDSGYSSQGSVPFFEMNANRCFQLESLPFGRRRNGCEPHKPDNPESNPLSRLISPGTPPLDDNDISQRVKARGNGEEEGEGEGDSESCVAQWIDSVDDVLAGIRFRQPLERTISSNVTVRSDSRTMNTESSDIFGSDVSIFGVELPLEPMPWDPLGSKIAEIKRLYADVLFDLMSFYIEVRQTRRTPQPTEAATGENASGGSGRSGGSTPGAQPPGEKRRRGERTTGAPYDGNDSGDGEDEDDSQRERPPKRLGRDEPAPLRFACPFFKKDPDRFRTCGFSDHENPSRVKQHIKRKHCRPIYCPRCSDAFKSENERDSHSRESNCPIKLGQKWEGVTADQLQQLSRRNTHKNDRDKWNAIFRILFPGHPLPDSPYLDASLSRDVNFVRAAFFASCPAALRIALENLLPPDFYGQYGPDIEEKVSSVHVSVFEQIFESIRSNGTTPRSCSPTLLSPSQGGNCHLGNDRSRTSIDSAVRRSLTNSPRRRPADAQGQGGMPIRSSDVPHDEAYNIEAAGQSNWQSHAGDSSMPEPAPVDLNNTIDPSSGINGTTTLTLPNLQLNGTGTHHTSSITQNGLLEDLPTAHNDPGAPPTLRAQQLANLSLQTAIQDTTPDNAWAFDDTSPSRNEIFLTEALPFDQDESAIWRESLRMSGFEG